MLRKLFALCLVLTVVLTTAACGSTSTTPSPSAAEITVTGVVVEATMNNLSIKTADGTEYTFVTENATIDMKDGLLLGDTVAITYTGDIKDGDTAGATVVQVRDGADNSKNPLRLTSSSVAPSAPSSSTPEGPSVTGTVTEAAMNSIFIQDAAGMEFAFITEGADIQLKDGLLLGDIVTVFYTGEIVDGDSSGVTVTTIVDGADNSQNPLRVAAASAATSSEASAA